MSKGEFIKFNEKLKSKKYSIIQTDNAPPLPPRLPPSYPTSNRRSQRKTSLDIVPVPPSIKSSTTTKRFDDSQHLLNQPNNLLSTNQQNSQSPNQQLTNQSNTIKSSNPILNQINSINNNYYGIHCNYFTVPNILNSSNYNSLNNSPIHNFPQLSHSNSFPNFNNLNSTTQSNDLTNQTILNQSSNLNQTLNTSNILSNQLNKQIQIVTNNLNTNASTNLDNLQYQQFILSKLHDLSKSNSIKKLSNDNLIDLGQKEELDAKTSVLNLFDPLSNGLNLNLNQSELINRNQQNSNDEKVTYSKIKASIKEDEVKELTDSIKSIQLKTDQLTEETFYESINYEKPYETVTKQINLVKKEIVFNNNLDYLKHRNLVANHEIINFKRELVKLRLKYLANNSKTNCGYVISSRLNSPKDTCLSVKLIIDSEFAQHICFTCNVGTSVEHVVCHTVCSIFDSSTVNFNNFILKVHGLNEFLINESSLGEYVYINECHKFDKDVKLTLINKSNTKIDYYARTDQDDENVENLNEYDILPNLLLCKYSEINYENVKIFLNIIDVEAEKLLTNTNRLNAIKYFDTGKHLRMNQQETAQSLLIAVNQAVKALCTYLGFETTQLIEAQKNLKELYLICEHYKANSQDTRLNDTIEIVHPEIIGNAILTMKKAIYLMLHLYSKVFPVNFYCELPDSEKKKDEQRTPIQISECQDTLICKIDNLNVLNCDWSTKYQMFYLKCELIHGEKVLACVQSQPVSIKNVDKSPRIDFDEYINFEDQLVCNLPRETYLYFTLIGISQSHVTNDNTIGINEVSEIGITSIRLFDHQNIMIEGNI